MHEIAIGLRIKLERIRRGILQRRVAADTNIPATVLSQIENNWVAPTREQVEKICSAIGIRPEDLVVWVEESPSGDR